MAKQEVDVFIHRAFFMYEHFLAFLSVFRDNGRILMDLCQHIIKIYGRATYFSSVGAILPFLHQATFDSFFGVVSGFIYTKRISVKVNKPDRTKSVPFTCLKPRENPSVQMEGEITRKMKSLL